MRSHECQFTLRELSCALLPTLLVVLGSLALLKAADGLRLLPEPPIELDPDHTVLRHQSRTCRVRDPAGIILLGDSTCLVDADALDLSRRLSGHASVLNLGLMIGLSLDVYGEVLSDFAAANPGQVRAVVLLVSPVKLAGLGRSENQMRVWQRIHHGPPDMEMLPDSGTLLDRLGVRLARERLASRLLSVPLHGDGAAFFGFQEEGDRYMTEHRGSAVWLGRINGRREPPPTWLLAPGFEAESQRFRLKIPAGAKLFIGLTPGPTSWLQSADAYKRNDLLRQWNRWISADGVLTNLPVALPDPMFTRGAHLNERGQPVFTILLARELKAMMEPAR